MGRWSYVELLGKNQCKVIIASVYCVCPQTAVIGSNTAYMQQFQIMLQRGHPHPDPRQQILIDLTAQIRDWISSQHEVLVCMDVNDSTHDTNPDTGIGYILSHMGLVNLHRHRHPTTNTPPTHNHGQLTIDVCLGTELFAHALIGTWYLPFGFPVTMPGNHQALGIDFDIDKLFGNKIPETALTQSRGVYSNNMPTVRKFNDMVAEACQEAQLFTAINGLYCKYQFTTDNHNTLKQVDQKLTSILTAADQKCNRKYAYPWSLALHHAYLVHRYWTLKLSELRTD